MGLTVHYFKQTKLDSVQLGAFPLDQSHTGEYLVGIINDLCDDWDISHDSVVSVVTDNCANMVKAVNITVGKENHLSCFAHTIQLVVNNAMESTPGLTDLFSEAKHIVTFFKQSAKAADKLRRLQLNLGAKEGTLLKLIQDVTTRWNSEFAMAKRFVQMASLVSSALMTLDNGPAMLNREQINCLKEIVKVLAPIEQATRELSTEGYVSCSVVSPMIHSVRETLKVMNTTDPIAMTLKENILKELNLRFKNMELNKIYAVATILDPRFKKLHFTILQLHFPMFLKWLLNIFQWYTEKISVHRLHL